MNVIQNLAFQFHHTAVCIGKFDGIHRGHRLLLEEAKREGLTLVMFTFAPSDGRALYDPAEKRALAEKLGVDVLIEVPLDGAFMQQSPDEFAARILREKCGADKVVVGEDFRFGYQRQGDTGVLKSLGEKYGFQVVVYDKLVQDGDIVSSTRIRRLIGEGNMKEANRLLGTPYFLSGIVERGNQLGRTINTPTANIRPGGKKVLPPYGVYAVIADIEDRYYRGVSNLGVKPTVPGENPVGLEVWLFDYEGDLYDRELTVYLMDYLRPERKFDSLTGLQNQIQQDTVRAHEILSSPDMQSPRQFFLHGDWRNQVNK